MSSWYKLLQQARQLPPHEQLRLISSLCEELRTHWHPQVVRDAGVPLSATARPRQEGIVVGANVNCQPLI